MPAAPGDLEEADRLKGLVAPERVEPTELPGLESEVEGLSLSCCFPKDSTGTIESAKLEVDVVLGLESETPKERPVPNLLRRLSPAASKAIRTTVLRSFCTVWMPDEGQSRPAR